MSCVMERLDVGLRDGCFCLSFSMQQFLDFLSDSLKILGGGNGEATTEQEGSERGHDMILQVLTSLENFVTYSVLKRRQFYCRRLLDFLLAFVHFKTAFVTAIARAVEAAVRKDHFHVVRQGHQTLTHFICVLPCRISRDEVSGDFETDCDENCLATIRHFMNEKDQLASYGVSLVHGALTMNGESEAHYANCQTVKVRVTGDGLVHLQSVKHEILNDLKRAWRSSWVNQLVSSTESSSSVVCCDERTLKILDLWRSLVDVRNPAITFAQSRDFTSSTKLLVDLIPAPHPSTLLKLKILEVLNEVLCYGSTLGIQSEIPYEPSEVAQKILQKAVRPSTSGHTVTDGETGPNRFDRFHIPVSLPGIAGNAARSSSGGDEAEVSVQVIKATVMVFIKAVAVVVKESQAVSSSDEDSDSNSSLSSRGSGSLAEEEREISLISGNVLEILKHLSCWCNRLLNRHHTSGLIDTVIDLFNDQDDALIEVLLCLLDININCYNQSHYFTQYASSSGGGGGRSSSPTPPPANASATSAIVNMLDPVQGFEGLVRSVHNDHSVLLDFLVSNETCFLLYFLRFLKFVHKRTDRTLLGNCYASVPPMLTKMKTSIAKLTDKSLFPYDISPVLKLLEKVA